MLFRYNERISLKFFYSQDDVFFQIGRKVAPVNASLLIIIFPNMLLRFNERISPKCLTVRMMVYFRLGGKVFKLVASNNR